MDVCQRVNQIVCGIVDRTLTCLQMFTDCQIGRFGWQHIGVLIAGLLTLASTVLGFVFFYLVFISPGQCCRGLLLLPMFFFLCAAFAFNWMYGAIKHEPGRMLVSLVFFGLSWSVHLLYVLLDDERRPYNTRYNFKDSDYLAFYLGSVVVYIIFTLGYFAVKSEKARANDSELIATQQLQKDLENNWNSTS